MSKLVTLIFLCVTLFACGQNKKSAGKYRIDNVCDKFMQEFTSGKLTEAIQLLKQNSVMSPGSIDTLQLTVADQIKNMFPRFGEMLSSEFVKEKNVTNTLSKRFYLLKFTKFFINFEFTLYNSASGWTITSFHYSENADELFE